MYLNIIHNISNVGLTRNVSKYLNVRSIIIKSIILYLIFKNL